MRQPLPVVLFAAFAVSPVVLVVLGAWAGGGWGLAALAWMALAAVVLDLALPFTAPDAPPGVEFPGSDPLLLALGAGALAIPPVMAAALSARPFGLASLALILAAGLWLGQVGHPAAHELIHRPGRAPRALGRAVYTALLIGHHASAHRLVHHLAVGTPGDPNSARAGEGFWHFAPRAWIGSFRAGLAAERARGSRAYLAHVGGALAALVLAATLGGGWGLAIWVALTAHAQLQILLSDYVQHYGLRRHPGPDGRPGPIAPALSWNAGHWASSALTLNATRHSDHHCHPMTRYPNLALPDDAPRLPWPLPVAAGVALVPPLWRRRMAPRLAALDRVEPPRGEARKPSLQDF
jgi:alkane 1-monooxygenase